ncbi:hypothetical protein F5148DRAFT_1333568 [Russula earlei]|uniref:Uncharacterized protein n=1 Tax=Russula earlei TaxID=71964 RepID=A0ACC0TX35_9AGAM|nr:hypothetical protein F5148DRAFT_1333568 [Russula earlei]
MSDALDPITSKSELVFSMYNNDNASEAPLYLVPTTDGTGKRLVRRPHPPPTTAPLPDDFDAITETRDGTTVYDDAAHSALDIDYDAITIAPATPRPSSPPIPIRAPAPLSPNSRNSDHPTGSPRQPPRRASSPSSQPRKPELELRTRARNGAVRAAPPTPPARAKPAASLVVVTVRRSGRVSVRETRPHRRSRRAGAPRRDAGELVEKLVLEDGPVRTISVWREHVAKNANEAAAPAAGVSTDGPGPGGGDWLMDGATWTVMWGVGG